MLALEPVTEMRERLARAQIPSPWWGGQGRREERIRRSCAGALASFALALFALLGAAAPARAEIYALAIGVNEYAYEQQLAGAEPDAVDIADSLRAIGAHVTLIKDKAATRLAIEAAWKAMVATAQKGDLLILSYAGHGGQEPDKAPLDEEDGLDEAFLLSGFNPDPRHVGFSERLVDDTIHDWLEEAGAKGLKVIFVADACHSGTMTRGTLDPRATVTFRGTPPYGIPETTSLDDLRAAAAALPAAATRRDDQQAGFVTFLSATQENRKAPEVVIDGAKRGALSYAFARAIDGAADTNHDGTLSRFELEAYVGRQVRQISEAQQAADLRPRGGEDLSLLALPASAASAVATAATTAVAQSGKLALTILGLTPAETKATAARLTGVSLADSGASADLIWDATTQDVITGIGDPVAHGIDANALQAVIDKWRALPTLKQLVLARPVDVNLDPDDSRHGAGADVAIYTAVLEQPYIAVVDIAPDATLQVLYPLPADPSKWPADRPYRIDTRVQAPFGADHVLLVASDKPLTGLVQSLKTLSVADLPARLEQELAGANYKLGLVGLYTSAQGKGE